MSQIINHAGFATNHANFAILQISAGDGPEECAHMVALTAAELEREAAAAGLQCRLLEALPSGVAGNFRSLCFLLEGETAAALAASWVGTVQWIWQSGYRPGHKRKNWYVKLAELALAERTSFDMRAVKIESMRAAGPGGQHVNKTASAVRVTHIPSGKSAYSQEARSQHMNKKLALAKLALLFEAETQQAQAAELAERRLNHHTIERRSGHQSCLRHRDNEEEKIVCLH